MVISTRKLPDAVSHAVVSLSIHRISAANIYASSGHGDEVNSAEVDRHSVRFDAKIPAQFTRGDPEDAHTPWGTGQILDLSWRGLFLATDNPEPPGTTLTIRVLLPEHDAPALLRGRVVWT